MATSFFSCHCEERSDVANSTPHVLPCMPALMIEPLRGGVADVAISTPHVLPCKPALMIEPLRGGHRTDAPETGKRWAIEIASHTLAMTEERRSR